MKKILSFFAVAAIAALTLSSCSDDESDDYVETEISNGVFVINSGNMSKAIDGSITYFDYSSNTTTQNAYQAVNGKSLGVTVNDAVVYGSKIYIVCDGEKSIFVADRNTLKNVATISASYNSSDVATPRHAIADGGYVYVSTYSSKVLAIDTLTNTVSKTYDCGSYSEGMAISNGYLYVADSDYGYGNASISKINLSTGKTETIKDDNIKNVTGIASYNGRIFFLDNGSYDKDYNQTGEGVFELNSDGTTTKIVSATAMTIVNGKIYSFDAPYAYVSPTPTYSVYDIATNTASTFIDGTDIASPGQISADAVNGYIYITSYNKVNGYASYSTNSYCVRYKLDGTKVNQFDCGVGAGIVVANSGTEKIKK